MSRIATRDEERIGDFTLDKEIGKGSFATVYKGYRVRPREPVAIKVVTRKKLTAKLLDNLEGEIAILKAINHPNIVELKDCLKTDSHIYLVMAFCSAGDLSLYIKKKGHLPNPSEPVYNDASTSARPAYPHPPDGGLNETVVRSFVSQLASALEFMRARDIVHRDIKPQNLLLQPPDKECLATGHPKDIPQMKVADFGFARNLSNNVLAETLCGSPLYMAPEILRYEKYDAKADLWSVGAVLYEMSVGKPPFRANNHVELLRKIEKSEDKIRFPDERSAGSLAREAARRQEAGEPPLPPPHPVSDDIKVLIRQLLKRKPVERKSFEEFFRSPVIEEYQASVRAAAAAAAAGLPAATTEANNNNAESKRRTSQIDSGAAAFLPRTVTPSESGPSSSSPRDANSVKGNKPSPPTTVPPSPSSRPSPSPVQHVRTLPRSFASKYVVGAPPVPPEAVSSSPSEAVRTTTSRRNSERRSGAGPSFDGRDDPPAKGDENPVLTPSSSLHHATDQRASPSADVRDDDSMLGKDFVMIEKRNVEVNALADELAASPQSKLSIGRRPSRLSRLGSGLTGVVGGASPLSVPAPSTDASHSRTGSTPPGGTWNAAAAPFALPPGARPSSFTRRTSLSSSGSPSPRLTPQTAPATTYGGGAGQDLAGRHPKREGSIGEGQVHASSAPNTTTTAASTSPSSALSRAISMASVRLFGVPSGMSLRGAAALVRSRSSRRSALIRSGDIPDPAEANLLVTLEDLGQKSFVLSEFADSKLANHFSVGPHQPQGVGGGGVDLDSSSASGGGGSLGSNTYTRRSSSTSALSTGPGAAEIAAAEALVLYVKSLTFLQRGINATKVFLEARSTSRHAAAANASSEVNEMVQWLRARFNEGYEKADFARSKCGDCEMPESAQCVDKMIFDKALQIARAAALDELENNRGTTTTAATGDGEGGGGAGWEMKNCLLAYETACSMLNSLLDPGEEGMSLSTGSIQTIETFVRSINKRLSSLQSKMDLNATTTATPGKPPQPIHPPDPSHTIPISNDRDDPSSPHLAA
ncbi:kinase-like protein [Violaceomyces palustris]|uniref:Kinase-like protein n=1 Tax=Violaceomyces palustris TaxID=1673888 RepID=A0ACD0P307_9BASI|nr:kinase-like protein [Violaceomyces palustris]